MSPEVEADLDAAFTCLSLLARAGSPPLDDQAAVADHLYGNWFHDALPVREWPSAGVYAALTAADELFEAGWAVAGFESGGIVAAHTDGRRLALEPGCFAPDDAAAVLRPGAPLRRLVRHAGPVTGFWHLWSDEWRRAGAPGRLVRLYLPLSIDRLPDAARALLGTAPASTAWAAKFLSGPHSAGRRDRGLIYLPEGSQSTAWVSDLVDQLGPWLTGLPIRLAAPLGRAWVAADPDRVSFGDACCTMLAEVARMPGSLTDRQRFSTECAERLPAVAPHLTRPAEDR
jgi:hypothetical protein